MIKRILLFILGLVILVGGAVAVIVSQLDSEMLRAKVADMTRQTTGKPLYMAEAPSLSLWPLGLSVGHASWGYEGGKPAAQGLSAEVKSALARLDLIPLLSGRIVVQEVRLDSPQLTLRPEQAGGEVKAAQNDDAKQSPAAQNKSATLPVELERLNISNGTLLLQLTPEQTVRVQGLNMAVSNLKPGAEAAVKLDMGLDCNAPDIQGNFSLAGNVRWQGDAVVLRQTKLSFTPLGGLVSKNIGTVALALDGNYMLSTGKAQLDSLKVTLQNLELEAKGQAQVSSQTFTGQVTLRAEPAQLAQHLGIALPAVPGTGKLSLQSEVNADKDKVRLAKLTGQADEVAVAADLTLGFGPVPAVLGSVKLGDVNLDAHAAAGAAPPAKPTTKTAPGAAPTSGKRMQSSGKAADTVYPRVEVECSVASLTVSKVKLEDIRLKVRGKGGKATDYVADPLELRLATGGTLRTTARANVPAMTYSVAGKLSALAVGPLLQALKGSRPLDATATVDYALTCAGTSPAAIKASLSGKGQLTATAIALTSAPAMPKVVPLKGDALPSRFDKLSVPFTALNGVVNIANMTLDGQGLTARGQGIVRLPQETVNMAATVNTLGLQLPVIVSGPFANLSYGVDPKWAAQGVVRAGGALLDGGKKGGAKAGDAAQEAEKLIRGLFNR